MDEAKATTRGETRQPFKSGSGRCACCDAQLPDEAAYRGPDRVLGVPGEFTIHVCSRCGCGVTRPFVADSDLAALYEGDYPNHAPAAGDGGDRGIVARLHVAHRKLIARTPPLSALRGSRGKLLDVGCGNAVFTKIVADEGWDVVGIEPDPAICQVARRAIDDVREGDIKTAALEAETFDAVLFNHTLEHVASPLDDLRRAYELLRPGGLLLVAVPNFDNWQRRVFGGRWLMLELPRHRTHFTKQGLHRVVERAGFTNIRVKLGTATGLIPASVLIALAGHMRPAARRSVAFALLAGSLISLLPALAISKLTRDGEVVTMVARRPRG